jgi:hypothetical protein
MSKPDAFFVADVACEVASIALWTPGIPKSSRPV